MSKIPFKHEPLILRTRKTDAEKAAIAENAPESLKSLCEKATTKLFDKACPSTKRKREDEDQNVTKRPKIKICSSSCYSTAVSTCVNCTSYLCHDCRKVCGRCGETFCYTCLSAQPGDRSCMNCY